MSKQALRIFAFLPFLLAIGFAAKVLLDQYDRSPSPIPLVQPVDPSGATMIQVALLLDVSGSMDGLLEQAKSQLWQIVNELGEAKYQSEVPRLEIALYIYGGDHLEPEKGFVQQLTPLTTDLDLISEKLFELTTNGGEEYCGKAVEKALLELNWTSKPEDLRMIFVAGNEPFSQGPVLYKQACAAAVQRDIIVNTIFCGPYAEGVETQWKDGADAGKGQYMNLDHNQEIAQIETPFDEQIVTLNSRLNDTYIAYGNRGADLKSRQIKQDQNAQSYGLSNLTTRSVSKSKKADSNQHWDLVDAAKEKDFEWEGIRKSLNDSLANLPLPQLQEYVQVKEGERKDIQAKIKSLDTERKVFIQEKQKESAEAQTLDQLMVEAVRNLAKQKNYSFEEK
jgi:hypothetical protein